MDRDDPLVHQALGKIAALALMMELMLCDFASRDEGDPVENIKRARLLLFSSLQNTGRPEDEFGEAVWEEMVEALDSMMANARKELEIRRDRRPSSE